MVALSHIERFQDFDEASRRARELSSTHKCCVQIKRELDYWDLWVPSQVKDSIVMRIEEADEREANQSAYNSGSRFFPDAYDEGLDRAWRKDTEIEDIGSELRGDQDDWHRSSEDGWYYSDEDPE